MSKISKILMNNRVRVESDEVPLQRQLLNQSEVAQLLGHQILRDALKAGWIKPRARKPGSGFKAAKVIYARADVEDVENRILAGEYPHPLTAEEAEAMGITEAIHYSEQASRTPRHQPRTQGTNGDSKK
jgi:hypothetical protein